MVQDYSMSSIKMRGSGGSRKNKHALIRTANEEVYSLLIDKLQKRSLLMRHILNYFMSYIFSQESPHPQAIQTPVSQLLKTVEDINTGSVANIPKHHKKESRMLK